MSLFLSFEPSALWFVSGGHIKMDIQKCVCVCVLLKGSGFSLSLGNLHRIRYKHLLAERSQQHLCTCWCWTTPWEERLCPNNRPPSGSERTNELLVDGCSSTGTQTDIKIVMAGLLMPPVVFAFCSKNSQQQPASTASDHLIFFRYSDIQFPSVSTTLTGRAS